MARTEARLSVDIWKDPDFLALGPTPQRLYMFLLSQADLMHTGVIALRERRWSRSAAGMTTADIERDLKDLEAARFVVVDWDAEELLVRSFIRRDKVYRMPQVLSVAADQLTLVASVALRVALRVELTRIAELDMVDASAKLIAKMIAALTTATEPDTTDPVEETAAPDGGRHPTEHGSDQGAAHALGDWGVVTEVTTDSPKPQSSSPNPQSSLPSADALPLAGLAEPKRSRRRSALKAVDPDDDPDFVTWWDAYANPQKRPASYQAWLKAVERIKKKRQLDTTDAIAWLLAATVTFTAAMKAMGKARQFVPHSTTFLNQDQYNDRQPDADDRATGTNGHRPFTNPTDSSAYYGDL